MKLSATDVSTAVSGNYTDTIAMQTTQSTQMAQKNTRIDPTEGKNISQITDYDKRALPISEKTLIDAIERANKAISGSNREFVYSVHKATKEVVVKVIDTDTNEVVREIPPEKILDLIAKIWEMAGIIVDERR